MKTRNDFVSNSSSSSFIVDYATYEKYYEKYGATEMEPDYNIEERNGIKCVEFYGWDDEHDIEGYDNDEEYVIELYREMCSLNPKIIEFSNNH